MPDAAYIEVQVGGHRANSRRAVALVDVDDAEMVGGYRWSMSDQGYARRKVHVGGKQLTVLMHREILGLGPGDPDVDHIHGNKLDNRRENLRVVTNAQNGQNRHQCGPYRGTYWFARDKCWRAQAQRAGKRHHLGYYATREEAAAVAAAFRREHMPFSADARAHDGVPEPEQAQTFGRRAA